MTLLDSALGALLLLPHAFLFLVTLFGAWYTDVLLAGNCAALAGRISIVASLLLGSVFLGAWSILTAAPELKGRRVDWDAAFCVYYETVVGRWNEPLPKRDGRLLAETVFTGGLSFIARGIATGARSASHRRQAMAKFSQEVCPPPLNDVFFMYIVSLVLVIPVGLAAMSGWLALKCC